MTLLEFKTWIKDRFQRLCVWLKHIANRMLKVVSWLLFKGRQLLTIIRPYFKIVKNYFVDRSFITTYQKLQSIIKIIVSKIKPILLLIRYHVVTETKQCWLKLNNHKIYDRFQEFKNRFVYPAFILIYQKLQPIIQFIVDKMKPLVLLIQAQLTKLIKQGWLKLRNYKIHDRLMGEIIDEWIIAINQYPWVKQLKEASQYDTRLPTLISAFFASLLALVFPLALMQVYDRIIPNRTFNTLIFLSLGVILVFIIEATFRIIRSYINLWADTKYEFLLGKTAFAKLINAPMYVYENTDVGTRLKQFAILDEIKGFYNTQLLAALYDIPFLLIFLITIAYLAGWLFLIPLLSVIITATISWRFAQHWKYFLKNKIGFEAKESDFIINVLTGIHTAKSIGMEELLIRRYERLQESGVKISFLSSLHDGDWVTIKTVSSQLSIILTATFGSIMVIHENLAIGGLAACILLASRIMRPFDLILSAFNRLSMVSLLREKLDLIFQLPSDKNLASSTFDITQGNISLKNISFHFGDYVEHDILKNLDLSIPSHALVGITGANQSEKTTLLNILATITKPTGGQYFLDQKDVDQYHTYALRKQIAYLHRSGKLFRGTIMDNLSAFDEKLIPAARRLVDQLGLNGILSRLPSGYDTFVGEKAVEALPGGVVNLIFIIRALVNKPKIILFDETNINLDTQSNQKMLELLVHLKESATIIVLASHDSTIALMDIVYIFQNGKLIRAENG